MLRSRCLLPPSRQIQSVPAVAPLETTVTSFSGGSGCSQRTSWRKANPGRHSCIARVSLEPAAAPSFLHHVNTSTKWAVTAIVTATVLVRHDAVSLWCVVGSVVAAGVCKVLKAVINEQRPPAARAVDPGMPSSHATSLSFLATYTAAALALQPNAAPVHQALSAGVMLCAAFLAWLRVHTGYHTALQTLAGFLLGSTAAAGWLAAYDSAVADWCRADPRHFSTIAALAAAAAAAFVFKMIGKPGK